MYGCYDYTTFPWQARALYAVNRKSDGQSASYVLPGDTSSPSISHSPEGREPIFPPCHPSKATHFKLKNPLINTTETIKD